MSCSFVDRQYWTEFIQLYRNNECLWKIKNKDYMDKEKKNIAYEVLAEKLRERYEEATVDDVRKRINNMRSVFRKEMKKVNASMKSSARHEDVYVPQLWYYNLLLFLKDQEIAKSSVPSLDEEPHDFETSQTSPAADQDPPRRPDNDLGGISSLPRSRSPPPKKPKRAPASPDMTESVLSLVGERLSSLRQEDEFDFVGKSVAAKLRRLPSNVEIVAEKLISDVLYEAQMGTLTPQARLVIERPTGVVHQLVPKCIIQDD
ncbi:uncharacterized protein LOC143037246 [Oratosquilla oratoria]|uniref:uncharacterized protein LOC143037246 n=1 Tax=Oratosquilla oratoria TaxID=337810 RepID=UPI003F75F631